jgi:hypothetical protein
MPKKSPTPLAVRGVFSHGNEIVNSRTSNGRTTAKKLRTALLLSEYN